MNTTATFPPIPTGTAIVSAGHITTTSKGTGIAANTATGTGGSHFISGADKFGINLGWLSAFFFSLVVATMWGGIAEYSLSPSFV